MSLPTRNRVDLVRNLAAIDWSWLISIEPKSKLSMITPSTHEKSSNVINESRMLSSSVNLMDIRSIVAIKIDKPWTENNSHTP